MAVILNPGAPQNNNGQPVVALPAVQKGVGWTNDKGGGVEYDIDDLLSDLTKPLEARIDLTDKSFEAFAWNGIYQWLIDSIKNHTLFQASSQKWMDDWKIIFQKDPTKDMSGNIYTFINNMVTQQKNKDDAENSKLGPKDFLSKKIDTEFTKFMDDTAKNTVELLDVKNIDNMDQEIDALLTKMHLDRTDKGVSSCVDLKQTALDKMKITFNALRPSTPNRPYKTWTVKEANNLLIDNFEGSLHKQSTVDILSNLSLTKASAQLQAIIDGVNTVPKIDSRTSEVIKQLFASKKYIPVEIFKLFLGNKANDFIQWENNWKDLFKIEPKIETDPTNPDKIEFSADINIKNIIAVPKNGKYSEISTNPSSRTLNISMNIVVEDVVIIEKEYSTNVLLDEYLKLANKIIDPITEPDYEAWLLGVKSKLSGKTLTGITDKELELLIPDIFNKDSDSLSSKVNGAKNTMNAFYKGISSDLKITFDIVLKGDSLILKPTIEDKVINALPTIDWAGSSTSKADQDYIDSLFRGIDAKYEKITPSVNKSDPTQSTIKEVHILSSLKVASEELYKIFDTYKEQTGSPIFKEDLVNGKNGDAIDLKFIERFIKNIKPKLDSYFKKYSSRFDVSFWIKNVDNLGMTIGYVVRDKKTHEICKGIDDQNDFDNIKIDFSTGLDIPEQWLDKLKISKTKPIDLKKVDGKLTAQQLDLAFPELAHMIKTADLADVKLAPVGSLQEGTGKDKGKLFQEFEASHVVWSGKRITHTLKMVVVQLTLRKPPADKTKGPQKPFTKPKRKVDPNNKRARTQKHKSIPKIKGTYKRNQIDKKPKIHVAHEDKVFQWIKDHLKIKTPKVTNPPKVKGVEKRFDEDKKRKLNIPHEEKIAKWTAEHSKNKYSVTEGNDQLLAAAAMAAGLIASSGLDQEGQEAVQEKLNQMQSALAQQLGKDGMTKEEVKKIEDNIAGLKNDALKEIFDQYKGNAAEKLMKLLGEDNAGINGELSKETLELYKKAAALLAKGDMDGLKELFELAKKLDFNALSKAKKVMNKTSKWTLLSLGSMLGMGSVLGLANAGKIASTNRKIKSASGTKGKIKSSKKLALISACIGLMSMGGSIGTFIYLFVSQGGL